MMPLICPLLKEDCLWILQIPAINQIEELSLTSVIQTTQIWQGRFCWSFNSLSPRQSDPDDTFEGFFLNENVWILIKMSLKSVPEGPFNNIPPLADHATSRYLHQRCLNYRGIYVQLGFNEWRRKTCIYTRMILSSLMIITKMLRAD